MSSPVVRVLSGPAVETPVTHCRVNAAGIAVEWVESTVAGFGQKTLICLLAGSEAEVLEEVRPVAGSLAVETGARILTVACGAMPRSSAEAVVDGALTAYRWLLGEGCDIDLAAFVDGFSDPQLMGFVLAKAKRSGLPLPRGPLRRLSVWMGHADMHDPTSRSRRY